MGKHDLSTVACQTEIIIPTLATAARASRLHRAINSVISQGARALVIVNGNQYDSSLIAELDDWNGIRTLRIDKAGLPNAIYQGRRAVKASFFGFLDDDDYLLPGAITLRESLLTSDEDIDVVIANGLREEFGDDPRMYKDHNDLRCIMDDPLSALLEKNWLTPCGALYRTTTVPSDIFRDLTKYAEWTDVAFRLIDFSRFRFVLDDTFVQTDSQDSLSKQNGQARYQLALHERIALKATTRRQRRYLDRRICNLHHRLAEDELLANNPRAAFRHHVRSLIHAPLTGIPRYLLYTRKFLLK